MFLAGLARRSEKQTSHLPGRPIYKTGALKGRACMIKMYKSLKWLDLEQALDYLTALTEMPVTKYNLLQFCEQGLCQAYVDINMVPGIVENYFEGPDIAIGTHRVLNPMAAFNSDNGTQLLETEGSIESDFQATWRGKFASDEMRAPIFKSDKILELAVKLNADPVTPKSGSYEDEPKPSHLLTIAALLELLKEPVQQPRTNGRTQDAIIVSIEEKFKVRGLGKRQLEGLFADANKAMEEAKKM